MPFEFDNGLGYSAIAAFALAVVSSILFAQVPPGMDDALASAASRGWEAVVLVVLVISGFSFFGVMFRQYSLQAMDREARLANRVTHLEDLIREKLFGTIEQNSQIMGKILEQSERLAVACDQIVTTMHAFDLILRDRPCMAMDAAQREHLIDSISKHRKGA